VALKTDGNSNKSRNNGIAIIMDALYQPEELANMSSLPVNSCSSMPGSKPKPAIAPSFCYASDSYLPTFFFGFMVRYWDQAYKGSILTEQQVKEAVKVPNLWRSTQERKRRKRRCWPTRHRHHLPQELPILLQFQLLLQRPSLILMLNYLTVIKSPSGQVVF
jgi:hypothetical protein